MIAMSKFATKADYWEYRCQEAEKLLRAVYEVHGPGSNGGKGQEPLERLAAMSLEDAQDLWDYPDLAMAYRIAVHLANR